MNKYATLYHITTEAAFSFLHCQLYNKVHTFTWHQRERMNRILAEFSPPDVRKPTMRIPSLYFILGILPHHCHG